jgi:hypothetical protein
VDKEHVITSHHTDYVSSARKGIHDTDDKEPGATGGGSLFVLLTCAILKVSSIGLLGDMEGLTCS